MSSILLGSLPSNAFLGYPVASFRIEERRSTTVHLIDAGHFDVMANDAETGAPVWAGRYQSFDAARTIADGLNRVWVASPQSTPAEVLAFVAKRTAVLVTTLQTIRDEEHDPKEWAHETRERHTELARLALNEFEGIVS